MTWGFFNRRDHGYADVVFAIWPVTKIIRVAPMSIEMPCE
jgi:hypothetical protein